MPNFDFEAIFVGINRFEKKETGDVTRWLVLSDGLESKSMRWSGDDRVADAFQRGDKVKVTFTLIAGDRYFELLAKDVQPM